MLVICNGAYKSGSSWLFNIAAHLGEFEFPEARYRNPSWKKVPSILPERLAEFVRTHDLRANNYVCKQHFHSPAERELIASSDDILLLDIERDIRDVIVSAYHHHWRLGRFAGSFDEFYWSEGPLIIERVLAYHAFWSELPDKVLLVSYERLHEDFAGEVARIAGFLRLDASEEHIRSVQERTTLTRLRERYGEGDDRVTLRFYRKGMVGDWRNHFSEPMLRDLEHIVARGLPTWRRFWCLTKTKLHRALRAYPRTRLQRRPAAG